MLYKYPMILQIDRKIDRQNEIWIERNTDRKMDRKKYGQKEIWIERNIDRKKYGQKEIWIERNMDRKMDIKIGKNIYKQNDRIFKYKVILFYNRNTIVC